MAGYTHDSLPYLSPRPIHPQKRVLEYGLTNESPPTSVPVSTSESRAREHEADHDAATAISNRASSYTESSATPALPTSIISPAFTPPSTPGGTSQFPPNTSITERPSHSKPPKLLPRLPKVECIVRARIPTTSGAEMFLHLYQNDADNKEHLAIVFGNSIRSRSLDRVREGETEMDRMIRGAYIGRLRPGRMSSRYDEAEATPESNLNNHSNIPSSTDESISTSTPSAIPSSSTDPPLVRIHSECYTGETAWSARCDCGEQLDEAARLMSETTSASTAPGGVIVYLRQEGRGIGLGEKLKAYNLQDLGSDTVEANLLLRHPADARSYGLATAMLVDLGLGADASDAGIRLLTNNPDKIAAVEGPNREIVVKERAPMVPIAWRTGGTKGIKSTEIEGYLQTKVSDYTV
ncbi:GTP cyclohydrolase II [Myotisia sp. PD_48]|nr:GTP cyclohydrolase II [Myotisia sp. PD_48]